MGIISAAKIAAPPRDGAKLKDYFKEVILN
jgi:hypothetical protein